MFSPGFAARVAVPGRVAGWERRFGHPSVRNWGVPDAPAPTSCLVPGEMVDGVVYGVDGEWAGTVERGLVIREAAEPIEVEVVVDGGVVPALTWPMGTAWADLGPEALAEKAARNVAAGGGPSGDALEYLVGVARALDGRHDPVVSRYLAAVGDDLPRGRPSRGSG